MVSVSQKTRYGSDRTFWENNTCLELNYKINNKKAKSIVWTWSKRTKKKSKKGI